MYYIQMDKSDKKLDVKLDIWLIGASSIVSIYSTNF